MHHSPTRSLSMACVILGICLWAPAHAGRPLTVDDAGTNAQGQGHVEAWFGRMPGHSNTWNLSPAYAPAEGLEFSALVMRDGTQRADAQALQVKWLLNPQSDEGCNSAVVVGTAWARSSGAAQSTPYLNGLLSCRSGSWAAHANLGSQKPQGQPTTPTWGLALEKALGKVTAHAEAFGERHGRPTRQVGLRGDLRPGLQLDGTLGRGQGFAVYSLGIKQSF